MRLRPPFIVKELAAAIGARPFNVISDLMAMDIFASMNQQIEPSIATKICEKHGFKLESEKRSGSDKALGPPRTEPVSAPRSLPAGHQSKEAADVSRNQDPQRGQTHATAFPRTLTVDGPMNLHDFSNALGLNPSVVAAEASRRGIPALGGTTLDIEKMRVIAAKYGFGLVVWENKRLS